jgi:hypothetical protein
MTYVTLKPPSAWRSTSPLPQRQIPIG